MTVTTTSAPGAVQLSSRFDASTSPDNAFLTVRKPAEPENVPATCKAQAGGHRVTRRTLMNIAVNAAALVAAPPIAVAAPAASQEACSAVAMLRRAEHCVECLRTRYVCDGWKMDEEAAERTLQYFRSQAEGQPENDEEWQAAVDFIGSHGQSLDWILRGEPGVMICGAASRSDRANGAADADAEILAFEEQIWSIDERAHQHDDELERLQSVWFPELDRLYRAQTLGECRMSNKEISDHVRQMPESIEHHRLLEIVNPLHDERDRLIKEMWKISARTAEGRRAKALVLIASVMGRGGWLASDKDADWDIEMARNLLVEFVGGEQGEELRQYWQPAA